MKEWCLGFIFTPNLQQVILLKKSRTLHVGLWNGVGGKIEGNETALASMYREGREETNGLDVDWQHAGYLRGEGENGLWRVFLYATRLSEVLRLLVDEITADWQEKAASDRPYRVSLSELANMRLAPHVRPLVYACYDNVVNPKTSLIQLAEVG